MYDVCVFFFVSVMFTASHSYLVPVALTSPSLRQQHLAHSTFDPKTSHLSSVNLCSTFTQFRPQHLNGNPTAVS